MDLYLKQWRNQQHESEHEPSAKTPKLLLDPRQPPEEEQQQHPSGSAALPLFVPETNSKISNLSAFPDSTTTRSFPRMGSSYFSLAQWQELELQALIYRYMLAGATVPHELLQPIKKSLLHAPPYFRHHPLQHYYQPALLQTGYWGRAALDPEPGRCRRTDGKKWRCSRDVVAGQKYCERHVHRGRNRSRKPVEIPTPTTPTAATITTITTTTSVGIGGGVAGTGGSGGVAFNSTIPITAPPLGAVANGSNYSLSGLSPSIDLLNLSHSSSDSKTENKGLLGTQNEVDNRSDGRILRHFFDDWPRSLQELDNAGSNATPMNSSTNLSISMPGNSSSDVSLKLSTGNIGEEPCPRGNIAREQPRLNWAAGWGTNQVASMGGPLAEALRSSTSNSSPTSVLHQLPRRTASDQTSYISI